MNIRLIPLFVSIVIFTFFASTSNSVSAKKEVILGKVVVITDGDTFKLLKKDSTLIKVRLANIDCPERKQPFSKRAKQFTADAIFGKQVKLEILNKDRYGRFIANVIYDDSLNLSKELLKAGFAWHFVKYSNDETLQALENKARQNKIGLWQDAEAVAPWDWRSNKQRN